MLLQLWNKRRSLCTTTFLLFGYTEHCWYNLVAWAVINSVTPPDLLSLIEIQRIYVVHTPIIGNAAVGARKLQVYIFGPATKGVRWVTGALFPVPGRFRWRRRLPPYLPTFSLPDWMYLRVIRAFVSLSSLPPPTWLTFFSYPDLFCRFRCFWFAFFLCYNRPTLPVYAEV